MRESKKRDSLTRGCRAFGAAMLVTLVAGVAVLQAGQADFAAATGFSGRNGFTCVSCHVPPLDTVPEAQLVVEGVPDAWEPGGSYPLTVRIEGGPPAVPVLAPQGGFEIAADAGRFSIPPDMEGLLRQPGPDSMTYTPDGTLMRQWAVDWTAPRLDDLRTPPADVTFWAAGVAANGNHNIQLNASDGGEHGDRTDNTTYTVPASPEAKRSWQDRPLLPPRVSESDVRVDAGTDAVIRGEHRDDNATHIGWRLDGGPWSTRETGSAWRLVLTDLPPGTVEVEVRSEGAQRLSAPVPVHVDVDGGLFGLRGTPAPTFLAPAALLFIALWVRNRR